MRSEHARDGAYGTFVGLDAIPSSLRCVAGRSASLVAISPVWFISSGTLLTCCTTLSEGMRTSASHRLPPPRSPDLGGARGERGQQDCGQRMNRATRMRWSRANVQHFFDVGTAMLRDVLEDASRECNPGFRPASVDQVLPKTA